MGLYGCISPRTFRISHVSKSDSDSTAQKVVASSTFRGFHVMLRAFLQMQDRLSDFDGGEDDNNDDQQRNMHEQPSPQLLGEILSIKMENQPPMFVSGWDEDEQDIEPRDMTDPVEQFLTAAEEGDLHLMERLLGEKSELLMAHDRDKYTALHRAAYSDKLDACNWLLSKGSDPEARTSEGWTPLHSAANWGNFEVVATLLSWGADVNSRTEMRRIVPLHLAVSSMADDPQKQYMTVKYLLETPGIEMNAVNAAGDTPMDLARRLSPTILEMGPKKPPNKRKAIPCKEDEELRSKKSRKVVIDASSDEEVGVEDMTAADERHRHRNGDAKALLTETGEEDEIVSEVGIYLLPLAPADAANSASANNGNPSSVCINRLQFPQQHPSMLRRHFNRPLHERDQDEDGDDDDDDGVNKKKCYAQYKAQVKHLRLGFGSDGEEEMAVPPGSSFRAGGGGIAELLKKQNNSSPALFSPPRQPPPSASTSSCSARSAPSAAEMFTGEGFSQHGLLNYAVGFFKEGRLFLLPVDKTYEMRKPLSGTIEREALATALKASASSSSVSLRSTADSVTASTSSSVAAAPLRIRFERAENDLQKRRREQSSFYKQKLVEQDQWIPLKLEHKNLVNMYERDVNQVLCRTSSDVIPTKSQLKEEPRFQS
uniref:ANK_REP_REGION domain-containing protein n=1 Tax=Globodera pallida TaxID=36090 RepID=A0A183CE39_GLOPA